MGLYITQDTQTLIDALIVIGFLLFILFLFVAFSIIGINKHLKDLVDLEYKKYDEKNKLKDLVESEVEKRVQSNKDKSAINNEN